MSLRTPAQDAAQDPHGLVDLVHGLLDEEERRSALERIAQDPAAERAFRNLARARERARSSGVPELGPEHLSWLRRALQAVRNPRPAALIGFGAATAVVFALIGSPDRSGSVAFRPLPGGTTELRSRSEEAMPKELRSGMAAYEQRDWTRAAEILSATSGDGTADLMRRLYLGSALAMSGSEEEALEVLEALPLDVLPEPWGSEARWTRALALERTGRTSEAQEALSEIAAEDGETADLARRLLREK